MLGTPVDVISVCGSDGTIVPLRMRVEDEEHRLCRVNIEQIVSKKEIPYTGMEAHIFLCRGTMAQRPCMFEIKYTFRTHCWKILRRVY